MNTVEKLVARRKEKKEAENAYQRKLGERYAYHDKEDQKVYTEFKKYIIPFNKTTIGGLKIKVVCHDNKKKIDLFINGKLHRTFSAETITHRCNCSQCCEGPSAHELSYSHEITAYELKNEQRESVYFSYYGNNSEEREACFVNSFDKLLEEIKENQLYKGLE